MTATPDQADRAAEPAEIDHVAGPPEIDHAHRPAEIDLVAEIDHVAEPAEPAEPDEADRLVREACRATLYGTPAASMRERLLRLAERPEADGAQDLYGRGGPMPVLEARVMQILDKPAARFVIKGVIAQQAILRAWCERSNRRTVVVHSDSHLAIDEAGGPEELHRLRLIRFGGPAHVTTADLDGIREPLGAVVVEVPLRRQGFRLPEWADLVALSTWCRERGVPIHLDGARLWEAAPAYDRTEAEIAALFDSVYVSFYKGLGGLAGAALAGPEDLIAEAGGWADLQGGSVFALFPQVLSALDGLDTHRPRMPQYRVRAASLAGALHGIRGLIVEEPRASFFCIHLRGNPADLRRRHREIAERTGLWLFSRSTPSRLPGHVTVEIVITDGIGEATDAQVRAAFEALLA